MKFSNRKLTRLNAVNYNNVGAYFITICTRNKEHLLSNILLNDSSVGTGVLDGPKANKQICIELTGYGQIADKYINQLNDFYENVSVDYYVIMPNHIHLLINISESGPSRTPVPTRLVENKNELQNSTVSKFISTFKRFSNKEIGENIWQMRSHDHIIRHGKDYDFHVKYIYENPIKWYFHGEDHDNIVLYE